jgi:hypothetical protein
VPAAGNRLVDAPAPSSSSRRGPDLPLPDTRPAIDAAPALPTPDPKPESEPRAPDRALPRQIRSSPAPSAPRQGSQTPALQPGVTNRVVAPQAVTVTRDAALPSRSLPPTPPTLAPLRVATVLQANASRDGAAEPAPIVHVTIDRIDVRLPSTPAAPTAPARRRLASAVGGLGDYLRGRPSEGHS